MDTLHFENPRLQIDSIDSPFSTRIFLPIIAASKTPSFKYWGMSPFLRKKNSAPIWKIGEHFQDDPLKGAPTLLNMPSSI